MEKIKIGDVCDILNGYAFKSENYVDSGIRIIRISNVQKGYIEDSTPAFYSFDTMGLSKFMLEGTYHFKQVKGLTLNGQVAFDKGELAGGDNFGVLLSVKYNGLFDIFKR